MVDICHYIWRPACPPAQKLIDELYLETPHLVMTAWYRHAFRITGPCITNVFATRRKNFSQWYRSFQRKLLSHWLKFLRHVAITLVIQGPGLLQRSPSATLTKDQQCGTLTFRLLLAWAGWLLQNHHVASLNWNNEENGCYKSIIDMEYNSKQIQ